MSLNRSFSDYPVVALRQLLAIVALAVWAGAYGDAPVDTTRAGQPGAEWVFAEDLFPQLRGLMEGSVQSGLRPRILEQGRQQRAAEVGAARAENRPQVRLHGRVVGNYQTRDDIDDQWRADANANLTVTQNLYHWGTYRRRETVSRLRAEMEGLSSAEASARHFMQLRSDYLHWQLMQERLRILELSIPLYREFAAARRQLVAVGQAAEQDALEMEARLLESMETLSFVTFRLDVLHNSLRQLVGPELDISGLQVDSLDRIQPMDDAAFERLRQRVLGGASEPSLARERIDKLVEMEAEQVAIISKRTWPQFQAVAGIFSDQLEGPNQRNSVTRVQYYGGVQVYWPLFDSWQTAALKRAALARLRAVELQAELTAEESRHRAANLLAQIDLHRRQIEARSLREQLLERRVTLLRSHADEQMVSGADRMEGELHYLDVRQRLLEARVDYLLHLMELGVLLRLDRFVENLQEPR